MRPTASPRLRHLRSAFAALLLAGTLGMGVGCSNSDANQGDTSPRSGNDDRPQGEQPGAVPGGQNNPEGDGQGQGRSSGDTP